MRNWRAEAARRRRRRRRTKYPPPTLPVYLKREEDGEIIEWTAEEVQEQMAEMMEEHDSSPIMERYNRWGDPFPGDHKQDRKR